MLARVRKPTHTVGKEQRKTQHQNHHDDDANRKQQLPNEIAKCDIPAPPPEFADSAFAGQHAVKEHKLHPAAHVNEGNGNSHCQQSQQEENRKKRQAAAKRKIRRRGCRTLREGQTRWKSAAKSGGSQFTCKKSDDGKPHPLTETEWLEQVLLHPNECGA